MYSFRWRCASSARAIARSRSFTASVSSVDLCGQRDPTRVAIVSAAAQSVLLVDRCELVLSLLEQFGLAPVLGRERLDLARVIVSALVSHGAEVDEFVPEYVEVVAECVAIDAGIYRELLGARGLERMSQCLNGTGRLGFGRVRFRPRFGADDVDAVLGSATRQRDVAGFLVERVGSEHERAVDGLPLRLVDRRRVRVANVTGVEIARR